jgi:hypothetical protein
VLEEQAMEIPVLVEPINNNGFRARSGEPLPLCAEGTTSDEAVKKLHELLQMRLKHGARLTSLMVGSDKTTAVKGGGIYREDDPIVQEWLRIMEENRRKLDEEEGIER